MILGEFKKNKKIMNNLKTYTQYNESLFFNKDNKRLDKLIEIIKKNFDKRYLTGIYYDDDGHEFTYTLRCNKENKHLVVDPYDEENWEENSDLLIKVEHGFDDSYRVIVNGVKLNTSNSKAKKLYNFFCNPDKDKIKKEELIKKKNIRNFIDEM